VRIVRERGSGKVLAMKKLRKAEMLRRGQVEHVKAERNVLAEVHSPYIVKLYYSFQVRCDGLVACWFCVPAG
jgi:serine/threonine kinase 38